MDITVLVFNGVTSREVLGPLEEIRAVTDANVRYVGRAPGEVYGFEPLQRFEAHSGVDHVESTDLLLVPGGLGSVRMMEDPGVIAWLGATAPRSRFVMSVSTGSLLLAAAHLLDGEDASGHWLAHDTLEAAGAHAQSEPVTWRGHIITTAGPAAAAEIAALLPERLMFGPTQPL